MSCAIACYGFSWQEKRNRGIIPYPPPECDNLEFGTDTNFDSSKRDLLKTVEGFFRRGEKALSDLKPRIEFSVFEVLL